MATKQIRFPPLSLSLSVFVSLSALTIFWAFLSLSQLLTLESFTKLELNSRFNSLHNLHQNYKSHLRRFARNLPIKLYSISFTYFSSYVRSHSQEVGGRAEEEDGGEEEEIVACL